MFDTETILLIFKQGVVFVCFAVMAYIVIVILRDNQKELSKISEIVSGLASITTSTSEQVSKTIMKLLEIIDRKM